MGIAYLLCVVRAQQGRVDASLQLTENVNFEIGHKMDIFEAQENFDW